MENSDVVKKSDVSNNDENDEDVKYFCGKRYVRDPKTEKYTTSFSRVRSGRYGLETVSVRLPVLLVPFIRAILAKCEEIETVRSCILQNVLHSTPNFNPFSFDPLSDVLDPSGSVSGVENEEGKE